MLDFSFAIASATTVALTISRIAGFVALSPFPGSWVPAKARVALVIALGTTLGMTYPASDIPLGLGLLVPLLIEVAIGLMIAAAFRFFIAAADIMASMISQATWLNVPASMNPDIGQQSQVMGTVGSLLALSLAIATGVHRTVIGYLAVSFRVLPVGSEVSLRGGALPFFDLVGQSFDVGMRLALPVLAVSIAVQVALALVSRVSPSLQIFNVGFAVLVVTGLVTFMASLPSIGAGLIAWFDALPRFIETLFEQLASPPAPVP